MGGKTNNFWSPIGVSWLDFELDTFGEYAGFVQEKFNQQLKDIDQRFNEFKEVIEIEKVDEEYFHHIEDNFIDEYYILNEHYIQSFYESQIIQYYSFLENRLKVACRLSSNNGYGLIKFSEFVNSSDLENVKLYLSTSLGIEVNNLNPEWSFINNVKILRNSIIHHNKVLPKDKPKHLNTLKGFQRNRFKVKEVSINSHRIEGIQFEFLEEIRNNMKSLFKKIEESKLFK